MQLKLNELTIDEFKAIISNEIKSNLQDFTEDLMALSSKKYLNSIREARKEYKTGNYIPLEEVK